MPYFNLFVRGDSLILFSGEKNEPFGLLFLLTPPLIAVRYPRIRGTAREDCDTKDFLSQPKKVLVTLIYVICSFFSAARRTNQEAPPLLSGFWVCRRSCRRGLRNSLRSDSPRPFSSVFLATSPPDKGGIGGSCLYSNPLALRALPLYSLQEHRGRGLKVTLRSAFVGFLFSLLELFLLLRNSPPCCGTRQGEE